MRKAADVSIVLMYHRVVAADRDPYELVVQPDNFAAQIDVLARLADVVPLTAIRERSRGRRVAITFDDGYADNLEVARPVLERAHVPATVFVASDVMKAGATEFWWDRLEDLLLTDAAHAQVMLDIRLGDRRLRIDTRTANGRQRALDAISNSIRPRPLAEIDEVVRQVADQLGVSAQTCGGHRRMTADDVRALVAGGLVDVGGHTKSHTMLSAMSPDEQFDEISGCKRALEAVLDRPVSTFAYPYGGRASYSGVTPRLVHRAGFALACTTDEGRVTPHTRPYRIPRLSVGDWNGEEFADHIEHLFTSAGTPMSAPRAVRSERGASSASRWPMVAPVPEQPVAPGAAPTFSVVITAYNVAPYLGEAIASALAQTAPALEVIVCDDGSTDDVDGAVAPYRDRISLIRRPNGGEGAAKNTGALAAIGDFVAFFDGDDVHLPERLEAMGALCALRPDLDIVTTNCLIVEDGRVVHPYLNPWHPFEVDDQRHVLYKRSFLPSPAIRRTRLLEVGGFDERLRNGTDVDCEIRLLLTGSAAGLVDLPLFHYRRRRGQLTEDTIAGAPAWLDMLGRLAERDDLDERDRAAISAKQAGVQLGLARSMVRQGHAEARAASAIVARDRRHPFPTRAKAAIASLAPRLVQRLRRERG